MDIRDLDGCFGVKERIWRKMRHFFHLEALNRRGKRNSEDGSLDQS